MKNIINSTIQFEIKLNAGKQKGETVFVRNFDAENDKRQKIAEGNKIIADFMGIETKVYTDRPSMTYYSYNGFMKTIDQMKYYSSWDWFMPVVYKINILFEIDSVFDEKAFDRDIYRSMIQWITDVELNNAFYDAITIIEWHNANKVE